MLDQNINPQLVLLAPLLLRPDADDNEDLV